MTGLGLIHIYTGPGKGKTTAAVGLAVRAAGRGIPVVFVQLMKNRPTGEVEVLSRLPGVTVLRGKAGAGFSSAMTPEERARSRASFTVENRTMGPATSWGNIDT